MIWGGRSILFFLGMERGKEKLKKSEMSLLSGDIVEKVGDKILHEIMEEDHKKLFVNEILQKFPFCRKKSCVCMCVCLIKDISNIVDNLKYKSSPPPQ